MIFAEISVKDIHFTYISPKDWMILWLLKNYLLELEITAKSCTVEHYFTGMHDLNGKFTYDDFFRKTHAPLYFAERHQLWPIVWIWSLLILNLIFIVLIAPATITRKIRFATFRSLLGLSLKIAPTAKYDFLCIFFVFSVSFC